jgi:rhodanese-related sulfurtransferase
MDISPQELSQKIQNNDPDYIIIDVREDWEYEIEHIAHQNISLYSIPDRLDEFRSWKDKKIVVHCNTGKRSLQAQKFLKQQGIDNIINLTGGLDNYKSQLLIDK